MATVVFIKSSSSLGFGESVLRSLNVSSSGRSLLLAGLVTTTPASSDGGCGEAEGLLVSLREDFGGEGACSFLGDLISSSLLAWRSNVNGGDAGFDEIAVVVSGRSTPLTPGVRGVSGGVGGTVVWEDEVTPSELGAFRLLGDEGV